jgi:hypothetical protein
VWCVSQIVISGQKSRVALKVAGGARRETRLTCRGPMEHVGARVDHINRDEKLGDGTTCRGKKVKPPIYPWPMSCTMSHMVSREEAVGGAFRGVCWMMLASSQGARVGNSSLISDFGVVSKILDEDSPRPLPGGPRAARPYRLEIFFCKCTPTRADLRPFKFLFK